ncbi:MAG: MFS transporter [Candidatus Atribacteria bacterium]|nr:MFS transporter [Candidatus Atribacteria bacterium]
MRAKSRTLLNVNLRWFLLAMILARSPYAFQTARLLNGQGVGVLMPAYDSLITKVVLEDKRGLAFRFFGTSLGILSLPMPWIGAQLWERFSPQTPFGGTVAVCAISIPIVWFKFVLPKTEIVDKKGAA